MEGITIIKSSHMMRRHIWNTKLQSLIEYFKPKRSAQLTQTYSWRHILGLSNIIDICISSGTTLSWRYRDYFAILVFNVPPSPTKKIRRKAAKTFFGKLGSNPFRRSIIRRKIYSGSFVWHRLGWNLYAGKMWVVYFNLTEFCIGNMEINVRSGLELYAWTIYITNM